MRLLIIYSIFAVLSACSSTAKYSATKHSKSTQQQILTTAKNQIGRPYHYGGATPKTGFDCSGLVYYSYKKAGVTVPRTTSTLYKVAYPVKRSALRKGDLVFFRINKRKISHVGLYLGNNKFVHAPSSGKRVYIANMEDKYWRTRFARGGRI